MLYQPAREICHISRCKLTSLQFLKTSTLECAFCVFPLCICYFCVLCWKNIEFTWQQYFRDVFLKPKTNSRYFRRHKFQKWFRNKFLSHRGTPAYAQWKSAWSHRAYGRFGFRAEIRNIFTPPPREAYVMFFTGNPCESWKREKREKEQIWCWNLNRIVSLDPTVLNFSDSIFRCDTRSKRQKKKKDETRREVEPNDLSNNGRCSEREHLVLMLKLR